MFNVRHVPHSASRKHSRSMPSRRFGRLSITQWKLGFANVDLRRYRRTIWQSRTASLQAQIQKLQAEAEALKAKEIRRRHRPDPHGHRALRHHARPVVRQGQEGLDWPGRGQEGAGAQVGRQGQARWRSSTATATTPGPAAATSRGGWSPGSKRASNSRTSPSAESVGAPGRAPSRWRALPARGCSPVAPAEQAEAGRQRLGAGKGRGGPLAHAQRGRSMSSHSPSACSIGKCPRARHSASRCSARRKSLRPRSRNGRIAR
jgi:hypothetical protein